VRWLFVTIQFEETDFFRRVGEELVRRGHEVAHTTISRHGAEELRARGHRAWCVPDLLEAAGTGDADAETARIEETYPILSLRNVWRTDRACAGRPEPECLDRTLRYFRAFEQLFDEYRPDVLVPEVGSETVRFVSHLVARERGVTVPYIFQTIFPGNFRLYLDEYEGPIFPAEELRPLTAEERAEAETYVRNYNEAREPTLPHRRSRVTTSKLRDFVRHLRVKRTHDRDNEYLAPSRFVSNYLRQNLNALFVRRMSEPLASTDRPFVYFPLHVTDDFKVKRVIPHCVDQAAIIEQIAEALPQGYDVVLKEHPWAIGKMPLEMMRRLTRRRNIRLVDAYTNSHELIQRSAAVVVISSTVGLEAILYAHPVLTLGAPFFSGYGVTVDVDDFAEIRDKVPAVLEFRPDPERCLEFVHACMRAMYVGKLSNVDPSDENAFDIADSLERAVEARRAGRDPVPTALERARRGELDLVG
jgi:hypothetical protein